jgi:SAM-dependent methyltransferase
MNDSHSRRARSFGNVAEVYREARPGYPPAAVEWALEHAPGRDVLDLAAGTGKLTEVIAATGAHVIAVEPLEGMRRELAATVPGATLLSGTAEQIPLPDGAVDAVLVGQAFHWFDQPRALDEMARVLRPAGIVGLIWNLRDESEEWAQRMTELLDSADVVSSGVDREAEVLAAHERFGAVEHRSWPNPRAAAGVGTVDQHHRHDGTGAGRRSRGRTRRPGRPAPPASRSRDVRDALRDVRPARPPHRLTVQPVRASW